jgi:hypothetical protein
MHPWRTVFLIHVFFILFISAGARCETLKSQEAERLFLQSELALAQKTQIYFILQLKEKKIYFKARGIVLRDLDIKKMEFWGHPESVKLYTLTGKASFSEPHREEITPENIKKDEKTAPAATTAVDIKALELEDMPASFRLKFDEGLVIFVKPEKKGMFPGAYSIVNSFNWYISQPILTVWYAIKSRPYKALNLELNEKDARALYWSIHEGAGVLIYNPQSQ